MFGIMVENPIKFDNYNFIRINKVGILNSSDLLLERFW
jgi:hypothetical protein